MPNTITSTVLANSKKRIIIHLSVDSDGSEETALVVYDSSAVNTIALNDLKDPLDCTIEKVHYSVASATSFIKLLFDASTDVHALSIPSNAQGTIDFSHMGGLRNMSGTGKTGDILLTTTGLASGDSFTLTLEVRPD